MENIKAKVTQDIVDSIIDDVQHETVEINTRFNDRLQEEIDAYRNKKEAIVNQKISVLQEDANKKQFKVESEMRFENAKKLRDKRTELLNELEANLKEEVQTFIASPKYAEYLNQVIEQLSNNIEMDKALIRIRKEDQPLLKTKVNYELSDLSMGGIICEYGNRVIDFSLETRFKDAMNVFINESKVNI